MHDARSTLTERYTRAALELPTAAATVTSGSAVDGRWLDGDRFFFVTEVAVDGHGPLPLPLIASRQTRSARRLVEADALIESLRRIDPEFVATDLKALDFGFRDPDRLLIQHKRQIVELDLASGATTAIDLPPCQQSVSPDGRQAVVVDGFDLVLRNRDGSDRRVTDDGALDWPYGQLPQAWLATLAYRQSPFPLVQWSPDGTWLLTHRIDERHLPERTLVESAPSGGGAPIVHRFRYATPRDPLPRLRHLAIHLPTGRRVETPVEDLALFPPLANGQAWFVDDRRICRIRSDRYQRRLELLLLDLTTGEERVLFHEETADGYLELHPILGHPPNVRFLPESNEIIWWSERDGWGHLYLIDSRSGTIIRQLTSGSWQVRDIIDIDAAGRRVLITAHGLEPGVDPILRSLAWVGLDSTELQVLVGASADPGEAAVRPEAGGAPLPATPLRPSGARISVSPDFGAVVVRQSMPARGSRTEIFDLSDGGGFSIVQSVDTRSAPRPHWLEVMSADRTTALTAALYLPREHDGCATLPLVDLAYPGPQSVFLARTHWGRVAAQAQAFADLGLAVLVTDSRGQPFRSRACHQQGYGDLLEPQMADHVAVIDQVCERFAFLDPDRVGIVGASAGGAAAAYALLAYPDRFHVGVALCGPYDPTDYLSGWVDKYVGPDVAGRWDSQRLARLAGGLRGNLMLIHGEMDDNVHPTHTLRLADALIAAGKHCEMLIVPGHGHMVQLTSPTAQRTIWDFLVKHLRGEDGAAEPTPQYGAKELAWLGQTHAREALWL